MELGGNKIVYPPEIYSTIQRPDVIWSKQTKRVMNAELACPAEEGIEAAQTRYCDITNAARVRSWTAETVTIEVGARSFVARTLPHLKRLGKCPKNINSDCKTISSIAAPDIPCT